MIKVIIDANVWIRFARHQNVLPLLSRMEVYDIVAITNRYLLTEIFDALIKKEWMADSAARGIIRFIESNCIITTENVVYRLSPDAKDNYLFDLAIQHICSYIISDDTVLRSFLLRPVPVKSCNWFLKHYPIA